MKEDLFGFNTFNNKDSGFVQTFHAWTPKTWHSFCLVIKDDEATVFLDKNPIVQSKLHFEVQIQSVENLIFIDILLEVELFLNGETN